MESTQGEKEKAPEVEVLPVRLGQWYRFAGRGRFHGIEGEARWIGGDSVGLRRAGDRSLTFVPFTSLVEIVAPAPSGREPFRGQRHDTVRCWRGERCFVGTAWEIGRTRHGERLVGVRLGGLDLEWFPDSDVEAVS